MKKNILIVTIVIVTMFVLFTFLSDKEKRCNKIDEYINEKYILSSSDKKLLSSRLNDDFLEMYCNNYSKYTEVKIITDNRDGNAFGIISLFFDKSEYQELKSILLESNGKISKDLRTIGIIDEYGTIYIEEDYLYENQIKLVFNVNLPYKNCFNKKYNEHISFFLEFVKI